MPRCWIGNPAFHRYGYAVTTGSPSPAPREVARFIREQLPAGGLFADQHWRVAVEPFRLGEDLVRELESLGRVLLQFYRAANLLHRQSSTGRQPAWVAEWLNQGKPESLLELQLDPAFKSELPRVIRPDLLLTEDGLRVTELDSVPGGIGLTAWLNQTYSRPEVGGTKHVLGGPRGMLDGFAGIFGEVGHVHLVVSEESASYRPEMDWLAGQLGHERFQVQGGDLTGFTDGDALYRFFELFDIPNVPAATAMFTAAREKRVRLTAPPKPALEEKLQFALLWNRNLESFWRQNLGEAFLSRLRRLIPYTWLVDPAPLPPQGAIPELNLTSWEQLKTLSQRERELILKVSGFSPEAWGARGVYLGSDLSVGDWSAAVDRAIAGFGTTPYVLQRYHKPRSVETRWYDFETDQVQTMPGRVRLCPYYFVHGEGDAARPVLGGVLATICPADKKIIHGMRDAILAPCSP